MAGPQLITRRTAVYGSFLSPAGFVDGADQRQEDDPYSGGTWRKELAGYGFGLPLTRCNAAKSRGSIV